MGKIIRLTENELVNLVKRIIKEQEGFEELDDLKPEDIDYEGLDDMDTFPEEDEFETDEIGLPGEDVAGEDEEISKQMRMKDFLRKNRPMSNLGMGGRDTVDYEAKYNPIKPSDLPLDKFLKSKYNK